MHAQAHYTIEQRYTVAVNCYLYAINFQRDYLAAFEFQQIAIECESLLVQPSSVRVGIMGKVRRMYYGINARFQAERKTK